MKGVSWKRRSSPGGPAGCRQYIKWKIKENIVLAAERSQGYRMLSAGPAAHLWRMLRNVYLRR